MCTKGVLGSSPTGFQNILIYLVGSRLSLQCLSPRRQLPVAWERSPPLCLPTPASAVRVSFCPNRQGPPTLSKFWLLFAMYVVTAIRVTAGMKQLFQCLNWEK